MYKSYYTILFRWISVLFYHGNSSRLMVWILTIWLGFSYLRLGSWILWFGFVPLSQKSRFWAISHSVLSILSCPISSISDKNHIWSWLSFNTPAKEYLELGEIIRGAKQWDGLHLSFFSSHFFWKNGTKKWKSLIYFYLQYLLKRK